MKPGRSRWVLATAASLAFAIGAATAGAGGGAADPAIERLGELRKELNKAEDHAAEGGRDYRLALDDAETAKRLFVLDAFGGRSIFGRCDAGELLRDLDDLDQILLRAQIGPGKRGDQLENARKAARDLGDTVDECSDADKPKAGAQVILGHVRRLLERHRNGELSSDGLSRARRTIMGDKRAILSGQKLGECVVVSYFLHIEAVDALIHLARQLPTELLAVRERVIANALKHTRRLISMYKEQRPCGEASPPQVGERCSGGAVKDSTTEYRVAIACDFNAETIALVRRAGPFEAASSPAAACEIANSGGEGRVVCQGEFPADQPVPIGVHTNNNASGETWTADVDNGRARVPIEVP